MNENKLTTHVVRKCRRFKGLPHWVNRWCRKCKQVSHSQ